MAASATLSLLLAEWQTASSIRFVALVFGLGGLFAFPIALVGLRVLVPRRPPTRVFAATVLGLAVTTIGTTALLFALIYRSYYAQWHGAVFSTEWFFEFAFTSAGAIYQFAVIGTRHFLPIGLPALLLASLWRAKMAR